MVLAYTSLIPHRGTYLVQSYAAETAPACRLPLHSTSLGELLQGTPGGAVLPLLPPLLPLPLLSLLLLPLLLLLLLLLLLRLSLLLLLVQPCLQPLKPR